MDFNEIFEKTDYCKICAKKDVCKYIEGFNSVVAKCNDIITNEALEFATGDIRCKYYQKQVLNVR